MNLVFKYHVHFFTILRDIMNENGCGQSVYKQNKLVNSSFVQMCRETLLDISKLCTTVLTHFLPELHEKHFFL